MSLLSETDFGSALPIDGYGPGFFRIAGEVHRGAVLVHANVKSDWGGYDDLDTLKALEGQVDVLFIGTGARIAHLPKRLTEVLEEIGIMCEGMATSSAARTYNVLLSEGRRVGAALLAMPEETAT